MRPGVVIALGLAVVLLGANGNILAKERLLAAGTPVLLELGPRDPRSLMQGDYMVLRYALVQQRWVEVEGWPQDGHLVVHLDEKGVGQFVRRHVPEQPLAPGELLLRYRRRGSEVRLGAESFFFQEGTADTYVPARYGELRVAPSGDSVLVGLRDEKRQPLGVGLR